MKKTVHFFVLVLTFLLIFTSLPVSAAECDSIGWYCVRNKDHRQPRLDPRLQFIEKHHGYYVDRKHGDDAVDKVVYLTFDAGYENGNIEKILNTLREEKVPGAFFVLENLLDKNPELILTKIFIFDNIIIQHFGEVVNGFSIFFMGRRKWLAKALYRLTCQLCRMTTRWHSDR